MNKLRAKPFLDEETRGRLDAAMSALEEIGWVFSSAEIAADNLAKALRSVFFKGRHAPFAGKTPSLYDVIDQLADVYGLSQDAVDASDSIKSKLEDSYRDDDDDDILCEVREWAEVLVCKLSDFFDSCPNDENQDS